METIPEIKLVDSTQEGRGPDEDQAESLSAFAENPERKLAGASSQEQAEASDTDRVANPSKVGIKIFIALSVLGIVLILAFVIPAFLAYLKVKNLVASGQKLYQAVNSQDLAKIKTEISSTQKSLNDFRVSLKLLSPFKFLPWLGTYISDTKHAVDASSYALEAGEIIVDAIEPYADIIGFSGSKTDDEEGDGAKTTQERIDFVVKSLPQVLPKVNLISEKVTLAKKEIEVIDPERYPVKFAGRQVRQKLAKIKEMALTGADLTTQVKPLLEVSPYLLGMEAQRNYLILFQNDKELRPTGGFMTAYAVMKVEKGKLEPVLSNDIYNLDARYKPTTPAPEPLIRYLKGPYTLSKNLRLRDMNFSPDFSESMKLFVSESEKVGLKNIDGVIAVDTYVVVNLLKVLGKIGVPGFGNFSTEIVPECGCPQVIYELESFADIEGPVVWDPAGTGKIIYAPPNYENRKKIVGPLMNSILANALGQPKDKLPALFEAAFKSLTEKHVLFYLKDEIVQKGVEAAGVSGRIIEYGADYLHINDSNLGGRKSNLYVTQEVEQDVLVAKDGSIEKTLTITYKNPEKQDGWLNSVLPNWVRVYVPRGSQLIAFEGVEEKENPYEDLGKTVFAGFFKLRPQGVAKVSLKYKLPQKANAVYKLFIQKQPGTDAPLYVLKVDKGEQEFFLKADKEISVGI